MKEGMSASQVLEPQKSFLTFQNDSGPMASCARGPAGCAEGRRVLCGVERAAPLSQPV